MSDAEQTAVTRSLLDRGATRGEAGDDLAILALWGRSSLILPMLEAKIEEVLKSPDPTSCFVDKTVDPQHVVMDLWFAIAYAGNEQSLREASKLLKIDEKRFDTIVYKTLSHAIGPRNPFVLAYQGFDIGDPAIDKRIALWAEDFLTPELPRGGNPSWDGVADLRHAWAEALIERYGGVPTDAQWRTDSLASRLKPGLAGAFHSDMRRLAAQASTKSTRK
jgi:hypothetical protein